MDALPLSPQAVGLCAIVAMLAGCGGAQTGSPAESTVASYADPSGENASKPLLYVANAASSVVKFLRFPENGHRHVLQTVSRPEGLCSDSVGHVFVTSGKGPHNGEIVEFPHASLRRIGTLHDPDTKPMACAVDTLTGNLAVVGGSSNSDKSGNVAIYAAAQGKPTTYSDPNIHSYFACAYDDDGNLYVEGTNTGGAVLFAELPKGTQELSSFSINQAMTVTGGIAWDGTYLVVGGNFSASNHFDVYQVTISGSTGTVANAIQLDGGSITGPLALYLGPDSKIISPCYGTDVCIWAYPAGNHWLHAVNLDNDGNTGVTVSLPRLPAPPNRLIFDAWQGGSTSESKARR